MVVIVAAGRSDLEVISLPQGRTPDNAKIVSFMLFEHILPKMDVFVTNGGFGPLNLALSKGVPMVVAGDTENKIFTAGRVTGLGPESISEPGAQAANRYAWLFTPCLATAGTRTMQQDCSGSLRDTTGVI
jgi:hypothetical protein